MDLKNSGYNHFHLFDTPDEAAFALTSKIIAQTRLTINKKGSCVWGISGGSTILKLYDALLTYEDPIKEFGEKLMVFWVDERSVPHTHKNSNFGNAYEYFWKKFKKVQLIPVPYRENVEASRQEYDEILSKNGIKKGDVDITILGMGVDGHTASLFPKNSVLEEQKEKIIAVKDPSVDQPRISMSFSFINSSASIYLVFFGKEKANTFRKALLSGTINNYPILGIDPNKLEVYTDNELNSDQLFS